MYFILYSIFSVLHASETICEKILGNWQWEQNDRYVSTALEIKGNCETLTITERDWSADIGKREYKDDFLVDGKWHEWKRMQDERGRNIIKSRAAFFVGEHFQWQQENSDALTGEVVGKFKRLFRLDKGGALVMSSRFRSAERNFDTIYRFLRASNGASVLSQSVR